MNLANKLTLFRIFLVFPAILFILCDFIPLRWVYVFLIFLAACYTDYLDGKIARKNNYITNFGKIMDPLADKILVISMFICFVGLGFAPILPVLLIVIREFIVTSVRLLLAKCNGVVIPANIWGKLKTVTQMFAIGVIIAFQMYIEMTGTEGMKNTDCFVVTFFSGILVWFSAVLSIISGGIYVFKSRKFFSF